LLTLAAPSTLCINKADDIEMFSLTIARQTKPAVEFRPSETPDNTTTSGTAPSYHQRRVENGGQTDFERTERIDSEG
jgi:hypothetical protein